jgi:tRNA A-37 threonylcarbamoyl transferase component Bud32
VAEEENIKIKDYLVHTPPLGQGAYGKVFRATYRGISDRALKIFRPGAVDLSAMARELEKLSQVAEHQGIVTLHDFDLLHEPPYYAMGLHADQDLEGSWETRTLERIVGHVDHREGWRITRDIADALAYLHQHQIIHCDIKPSNILLTDEIPYHTKICDFGQSRGLVAEGYEPVGTPLYASPEQLRAPRNSAEGKGFRWDVYSFGVLTFKLLTGELPRLQALSQVERASFDPDATLVEASLEATMAETGNAIDGEQLATLTEAVEDITWPADFYVPSDRKELIEQCLKLNPTERPADMREVWSRIQHLDQQAVVRKARRLNTIFATLLVVAIWASGFAFVQAQRAKTATESARIAMQDAEQNAGAAMDLFSVFIEELNNGEITTDEADRLYAIVADNASTFIENRLKNNQDSEMLHFSAQTAYTRAIDASRREELDEALREFTAAYEIHSELSGDANATETLNADFPSLTARALMGMGRINENSEKYPEAILAYNEAKEWRLKAKEGGYNSSFKNDANLSSTYRSLSRAYSLNKEDQLAIEVLDELHAILEERISDPNEENINGLIVEAIKTLDVKGETEYEFDNLDAASATFQRLMELAESLEGAPPTVAEKGRESYISAINALGRIQLEQKQPEAALVLFREEINLREERSSLRPYNPEIKVALAEAYHLAAKTLELENESSRSLAIFYLEQATSLINRLPSEVRYRTDVQASVIEYTEFLGSIREMEE